MVKIIRVTTVPASLKILLKGQLRFMHENGFDVIGVSSLGDELQYVDQYENVRTVALKMTRRISLWNDLYSLWLFYRLCKNEKPVIVHSHTPKAGIVCMLGAKFAGVPIRLHTVAGLPLMEAKGIKRILLDFVEKLTYSAATKVYPNSKGLYDFIVQNKFTFKDKLKLIGLGSTNGIDTDHFCYSRISDMQRRILRDRLSISQEDFVFIFVGRLVGDKGINELVQAFLDLSFHNKKLLLVGSFEPELDPLHQKTIQALLTNPRIVTVGFQEDVRTYYAISDCLVFPSYREGFPNVVLQAGAMGLPSIVSDITGCNEIIKDGVNGVIIPVKDLDSLVHAMNSMYKDPQFLIQLKHQARSLIMSRYEQRLFWKYLLDEYKFLISYLNT